MEGRYLDLASRRLFFNTAEQLVCKLSIKLAANKPQNIKQCVYNR